MKQTTKYLLGIAAASALVMGASGVFARGGFGPGWGGHHSMRGLGGPFGGPGMMIASDSVAVAEQRLARLKTRLGITPAQEEAWTVYADAVKGKAGLMTAHRQVRSNGTVSPEQRVIFRQEGLAQRQKVTDAVGGLYTVLTPQQRATTAGNLRRGYCRRW